VSFGAAAFVGLSQYDDSAFHSVTGAARPQRLRDSRLASIHQRLVRMELTDYHAKYFAHELTRRCASDSVEKLVSVLADAQVDLNPHQVEAALFAFRSPFSKGAILADEVGLGKTIEAGLLIAQKWAERKHHVLVIVPANLRKQWAQELADKFFLPSAILETRIFNEAVRAGNLNPFAQDSIILCSYQFARTKEPYIAQTHWDLIVIDEAHRLRNVYKNTSKSSVSSAVTVRRVHASQPWPAEEVRNALVKQKMLDADGRIQPAFDPRRPAFRLELPASHQDLIPGIVDLLSNYRIEQHIRRERDMVGNTLKKEVVLGPDFQALWVRIKPKTTYRVEFETGALVQATVRAIKQMERVEKPRIRVTAGRVAVAKGGVVATSVSAAAESVDYQNYPVPDLLAYLQGETELTRSTLVRILKESGRLAEFFNNPQLFMDKVASILRYELHRLLVEGIKYERIERAGPDSEWEMSLFESGELINYLTSLQVNKSVYEYVPYESEIEREFARRLDEREDIKLFVKLPSWFKVDTPVGEYNPDWAIVKRNDDGEETLYLVRETKAVRGFLKLRTSEADKVRCGQKHFEAIGVDFDVSVTADEV
jgi:hypothetical protein